MRKMKNYTFLNIFNKRNAKNTSINSYKHTKSTKFTKDAKDVKDVKDVKDAKDLGAVTAEFAIILPTVAILAIVLIFVGKSVVNTMNCNDAAGQVAYYIASTHDSKEAQNIVHKVSGKNSSVKVEYVENMADIVVSCPVVPDPLKILPMQVEARISQVLI
ncbi:TadE family protein [Gardnerella pickettii]|uniref:TadE family protein n=1 Tax=Gardnerella pickettii TaxID=2914924 RepID=UPI0039EEAE41